MAVRIFPYPSGDLEQSREDTAMIRQVVEAGKILGIPIHDHIIVGTEARYTSFAERGLI